MSSKEIFNGDAGLLGAGTSGKVIINMSAVSPAISRKMAAACVQQGNHYLDALVSGSVKQAEEGQLVIMVGGDTLTFETCKPILEKIGRLALLVGEPGAGRAKRSQHGIHSKDGNNAISCAHNPFWPPLHP